MLCVYQSEKYKHLMLLEFFKKLLHDEDNFLLISACTKPLNTESAQHESFACGDNIEWTNHLPRGHPLDSLKEIQWKPDIFICRKDINSPLFVLVIKNEASSSGHCDPAAQAIIYYYRFVVNVAFYSLEIGAPCIVAHLQGTHLYMHAVAFVKDHIRCSSLFDCEFSNSPQFPRFLLFLQSLKNAVHSLSIEYAIAHFSAPREPVNIRSPVLDILKHAREIDSSPYKLFLLVLDKSAVKFVTQSAGIEAQILVSFNRCAPKIVLVRKLGSYYMIVMDYEIADKEETFNLEASLLQLHATGLVHGDVCSANRIQSKFIDFEWAGPSGLVRYPYNISVPQRLDLNLLSTSWRGLI
ncbi:hypothetical protein RCL1_001873 [Eukaryota sp. TZLM3-RCL]